LTPPALDATRDDSQMQDVVNAAGGCPIDMLPPEKSAVADRLASATER
jgi:hypothetical protein